MGRLGITYEQVAEAAALLVANGENPTIERVRRTLGDTGSNSNVSKDLRQWERKLFENAERPRGFTKNGISNGFTSSRGWVVGKTPSRI